MPITAPIFDPDRGWRMWLKSEIYTGPTGTGRYVPNIEDAVWDWTAGVFKVVDVNITTGLSTLVLHTFPTQSGPSEEDIFLGAGPGPVGESFRLYVDKSVVPHTVAIDSRVRMYSTESSYIKLFLGTDISVSGTIISAYYNQSGTLVGENIPLDSITVPGISNAPIKFPKIGSTSYDLHDGEIVTCVAYNDVGQAICTAKFIVKETAFIRQTDAGQKYISGISIESPFLSLTNNKLIEYPINATLASIPLIGVVTYTDGSVVRLPIDGTKFSLYGRDQYVSTVLGQKIPLVLSYQLGVNESNYASQSSHNQQISVDYEATTVAADGTYSVKLFVFPVWTVPSSGTPYYRLEYFLYNLDRQQYFHVTPYIEVPTGSNVYDPTIYGMQQYLTVSVDLAQVNGLFSEYRHVQTFRVALMNQGDVANFDDTRWLVTYEPGQNPVFGDNLIARCEYTNINSFGVDITAEALSVDEWLNKTYYACKPLFNPATEDMADIRPTHFRLRSSTNPNNYLLPTTFLLDAWNDIHIIDSNDIANGEVLFIDFIKRVGSTDLQMGTSGLPFRAVYVGP
jgi:hypothetical protein